MNNNRPNGVAVPEDNFGRKAYEVLTREEMERKERSDIANALQRIANHLETQNELLHTMNQILEKR